MQIFKNRVRLAAGIVLLAIIVILLLTYHREPSWQGRRLSQWMEDFGSKYAGPGDFPEGEEAVRHFDTNAIPYLVQWIEYQASPLMQQLRGFQLINKSILRNESRAIGSLRALERLGPRAMSGLPRLARKVQRLKPQDQPRSLVALSYLGEQALPEMIMALTNRHISGRSVLTDALYKMGDKASPALLALQKSLHDPDPLVRGGACAVLGRLQRDPVQVIPALSALLADTEAGVRGKAIVALGNFGPQARSAVPALEKALQDPDALNCIWATNALYAIEAPLPRPSP